MSNFKRASMAGAGPTSASPSPAAMAVGNKNGSILNALRATTMIDSKPVLPAEILATILDYLPVSDLFRFARTSRRMREMVYDDTRWVARLRSMGVWDEAEARRRFEEVMKRRREAAERAERERLAAAQAAGRGHNVIPGQTQHLFPGLQQHAPPPVITTTLFDAGEEEQRRKRLAEEQAKREQQIREAAQRKAMEEMEHGLQDGFETLKVGGAPTAGGLLSASAAQKDPFSDPEALLSVIKNARSIRGHARQEYGKIYGALAPFYFDLAKAKSHTDPVVFRVFRDPERQAQMLANLRTFAKSDWAAGWRQREEKLATMAGIFESAVLHEFETGYEFWDVDGRMRKYAHVLDLLNGGTAAVELFIQKHPIFSDKEVLANPMDCVNQAMQDDVTLEPSRRFFEVLTLKVNEQADIIQRVFPKPAEVFWLLMGKIRDDILTDYVTPLFDETHERSLAAYVKAVSGLFEQTLAFFRTVNAPKDETKNQEELAKEYALKVFEQHLDLYLADELDYFTKQAEAEVAEWDKKLSEEDATAESFYMGSFTNRQADKKDFLTSFKKVVMMPVSVLPSLPLGSPFASSKPATTPTAASAAAAANGEELQAPGSSELTRSTSPSLTAPVIADRTGSPLPDKAPTDELAAKAALMTSRLEGIKSLFSIEVALSLVHEAKSSLGRAAVFIQLGGQAGGEARDQCEAIFVALLRILGGRHIKPGFDKAVAHLSQYNPREVSHHDKGGVAPLVTFIELVNVGDLISQMIDVFYEQQLTTPKIADRNDFLDPAGLAKKKFEQMLDESVAAGLNKGIDVLMDEVEYVCATTQLPTDYNPTMTTDPFSDAASISGLSTTTEGTANTSSSGGNNRKSRYKSGTSSIWSLPSLPGTPTTPGGSSINNTNSLGPQDIGPTATALRIRDLVASHTSMLTGSTDKSMLDVFNGEVGLRLFAAVCKHLKRQRISTEGAIKLIADVNLYYEYIRTLKNNDLLAYFKALRELSQIYLIDAKHHAKEMATIIADNERFSGVFRAEEVYEYAERRADWYNVRKEVERAMYGLECLVM